MDEMKRGNPTNTKMLSSTDGLGSILLKAKKTLGGLVNF